MPNADLVEESEFQAELFSKSFMKAEHLLARFQPERNQIQWVKVTSRGGEKATWDWFNA
jgi:hypothetical protein